MRWHLKHAVHGDKPWAVQAEALRRGEGKLRRGNFLEQGLGKTSLTLNEFVGSDIDLAVMFAPNTFKLDWTLAPEEWGVPEVRTGYWPRDPLPTGKEGKYLYAINYEAVRSGAGDRLLPLFDQVPVFLGIDESSALSDPGSQQTKAVMEFAKAAKMVRELNGTPITNNVMDLFAQLRVLGELEGVNRYQFRNRFAKLGGYMGKKVVGMQNESWLYELMDNVVFRALKADWRKDLPPKVYRPTRLEMSDTQRKHYREMMQDFITLVSDGSVEVSANMVLTQMEKLRQIAAGFIYDENHNAHFFTGRNPKIEACYDIIEGGPGKTVIAHWYTPVRKLLLDAMTKAGYQPAFIGGNESPEQLVAEKKRFNEDPNCRVVVCQIVAAHMGHTLLGQKGNDRANKMIMFDNSFSWRHRAQLEDRIHRGEADQDCQYFDLLTSPIDQRALDILKSKKDLADAVDSIVAIVRGDPNL